MPRANFCGTDWKGCTLAASRNAEIKQQYTSHTIQVQGQGLS